MLKSGCVFEKAARKQHVLLPVCELHGERDLSDLFSSCGSVLRLAHDFRGQSACPESGVDVCQEQHVALLYLVIISLVLEDERQYAGVDEVGRVYAREGLGDHGFDAKRERNERGVLTG